MGIMGYNYRTYSKTASTPRVPFDKVRLSNELQIIGEFGLKNKREVYRVQLSLAKLRSAARYLLTLPVEDPVRIEKGAVLIQKCVQLGYLLEDEAQLDYILGVTIKTLMNRRLQTIVFRRGLAKSIHHARVLIQQGHIRVRKQKVNSPSLMVKLDSESLIDFHSRSPLASANLGRVARKNRGN